MTCMHPQPLLRLENRASLHLVVLHGSGAVFRLRRLSAVMLPAGHPAPAPDGLPGPCATTAVGPGASASAPTAHDMAMHVQRLRDDLEQLKIQVRVMIDAKGEEVKRDLTRAGNDVVDDLRVSTQRVALDVDQMRRDCITLQTQVGDHQSQFEMQTGTWRATLAASPSLRWKR